MFSIRSLASNSIWWGVGSNWMWYYPLADKVLSANTEESRMELKRSGFILYHGMSNWTMFGKHSGFNIAKRSPFRVLPLVQFEAWKNDNMLLIHLSSSSSSATWGYVILMQDGEIFLFVRVRWFCDPASRSCGVRDAGWKTSKILKFKIPRVF